MAGVRQWYVRDASWQTPNNWKWSVFIQWTHEYNIYYIHYPCTFQYLVFVFSISLIQRIDHFWPLNMNIFFFSNRSVSTADAPNWDQLGSSLRKFSFITDNIGNLIGSPGRRPSMPAPSMESESRQRKG